DLVRAAAAGDLADHVLRGVFAVPAAIQRDAHPGARVQRDQARELVGVGVAQRGRGDRLHAVGEAGAAGVGDAVVVGAGRTHQVAGGAGTAGGRRAGVADPRHRAVAVPVLRAFH